MTDAELKNLFYVDKSPIHGKGLFAKTHIEEGTYLGEYRGPESEENGMHVLWVEMETDQWVGRDGKNLLRYLNHSTEPCAEFDGFELYALTDIQPDMEVTFDYGEDPA